MPDIIELLFSHQDLGYKAFHSKLIPDISPDTVIGVRVPVLRKLAKELSKGMSGTDSVSRFLSDLPHKYYEENNLHGLIVSEINDYDECVAQLDRLLPYVDNWATCDMILPKCFKKPQNHPRLLEDIARWMSSDRPFTIRFGIGQLMSQFLDDDFRPEYLERVASIRHEHYYVRMMQAWYFATALAKQWDAAIPYIQNRLLDPWTHNKSIQKSIESFRVTSEHKEILRGMRR